MFERVRRATVSRLALHLVSAIYLLPSATSCQILLGTEDRRRADSVIDAGTADGASRCPLDMAEIFVAGSSSFCIDKFEASRAAANQMLPASIKNAAPWTNVNHDQARNACTSVDKRLCKHDELVAACAGMESRMFPYGAVYQSQACNGVDYAERRPVPTGSLSTCEGATAGVFDLSGNVAEWVLETGHDEASFICSSNQGLCGGLAGGSWRSQVNELRCGWTGFAEGLDMSNTEVGFRCCSSR
jgi:formylglycine-generating enzyme required for sulfatase activity